MRKLLFPLVLATALALFVPAAAQAFKPEIVDGYATFDSGQVTFTVKVRMDKGGRSKRAVKFTYEGDASPGNKLKNFPAYWESDAYNAPKRDCYSVTVEATNLHGTTTKNVRAGRIGTDGCGQ